MGFWKSLKAYNLFRVEASMRSVQAVKPFGKEAVTMASRDVRKEVQGAKAEGASSAQIREAVQRGRQERGGQ